MPKPDDTYQDGRRGVVGPTLAALLAASALLAACGGAGGSSGPGADPAAPVTEESLSPIAAVGEKIFHDASLSEPAGMSCASCHRPELADASNDVVQAGVVAGRFGTRNAPSLRYLKFSPDFGYGEDGPVGGFFRDGRARTFSDQAQRPFTNPDEMANPTAAAVVAKVAAAPYAAELRAVWGERVFDDPAKAFDKIAASIAAYQREDADFAPFSSKFDAWRAGRAQLGEREAKGLALFNDPAKGNCAACHPSSAPDARTPPLFTDFTYDNLGLPRNPKIPANADPAYFDLGLCGPARTDVSDPSLCGAFKVPTLRNIAITAPYFHNGAIASLRDAVRFYVTRDTDPQRWYPANPDGSVNKFDDLPARYHGNVNTSEAPYDRKPGQAPALDDEEIDLVVEFLGTLTDGYTR